MSNEVNSRGRDAENPTRRETSPTGIAKQSQLAGLGWRSVSSLSRRPQQGQRALGEHRGISGGLGLGGVLMGEYLRRHFDFGATVVVFNTGATDPELAGRLDDAVWGQEAMQAYRDFLALRLQ